MKKPKNERVLVPVMFKTPSISQEAGPDVIKDMVKHNHLTFDEYRTCFFRFAKANTLLDFPGAVLRHARVKSYGWQFVLDVPHTSLVAEKITELK